MVAMSRPDTSALARKFASRFLLRLDSGALLGDGPKLGEQSAAGPILLPADRAFDLGRLGPEHASRLESKLQKAHSSVPGARPLQSVSSGAAKHQQPEAPLQQPAAKRHRTEPSVGTAPGGAAGGHRRGPPSPSSQNVSSWRAGDFKDKCTSIVQRVISGLGPDASWFTSPVSATQVRDYHSIISQPMDMGTILKRLDADHYASPKDFSEDMRLVWSNCVKYNGTTSLVGKVGVKGQNLFEQFWAGSGLSDEARTRRTTAGVAAPKYEPAAGVPEKKPKKLANGQPSKLAKRSSKSKGGFGRMHSTASHAFSNRPMDRERKQMLADSISNLEESKIDDVMKLLREAGVPQSETGECELDFDSLDNSLLWQLDHIINPAGYLAGNGHMDSDTDSFSE